MGALATAVRTRHDHHTRLIGARRTTDELFQILRDDAFYERPIAERHRVVFYLGHVEAFDWNLLGQRAFGLRRFHPSYDQLFAFGIDPVGGGLPTDKPADWPSRAEIAAYNQRIREALDVAIEQALEHPSEGHPQLLTMLETAIEHRLMHAETLAYMFHRLPLDKKKPGPIENHWKSSRIEHRLVDVPEGVATLGLPANDERFGWDNERGALTMNVPAFSIENHNVSNREFMHFVQNGGYRNRELWSDEDWTWREENGIEHPAFWQKRGNIWTFRGMFSEQPLHLDRPAYVSLAEASAYAKWLGRKLPTEEQFHRAAYGEPGSEKQRDYPWGDEPPTLADANLDAGTLGCVPVGAFSAGDSAFGCRQMLGNVWEWTASDFLPYPGFAPNPDRDYSKPWFGADFKVLRGGSWATRSRLIRNTFRDFALKRRNDLFAGFRTCAL